MLLSFDSNHNAIAVSKLLKRGPLQLGTIANIDCANVQVGKKVLRVVSSDSFLSIIGISPRQKGVLDSFGRLLKHPSIRSARSMAIVEKFQHGYIVRDGVQELLFVDSRAVTDFCRLVLDIRRSGILPQSYLRYAEYCERFMLGLADVGLAAMIDEATGYDKIKRRNEYRELFKAFIREERSDWVKEFPDAFFDGIYKVYRVERTGKNHPSFFGGFINKYVYVPIVNSHGAILKMLQKKNPMVERGGRRWKLHQFLTDEVGKPALRSHLAQVEVLLRVSSDKGRFQRLFKDAFPQRYDQLELDFGEE